jgi:cyclopropane-fatty-acyl-phospholipid synthase
MLTPRLLEIALSRIVRKGTLVVLTASGHSFTVGNGDDPKVKIRFADTAGEWALCLDPELKLGELYMDGRLTVERGSLFDFLQLVLQDTHGEFDDAPLRAIRRVQGLARRWSRANNIMRSRHNVAHHYDLDARLYALFLDSDWQYSCAYFERPDADLEEAQRAKKRHITAKLLLEPGQHVLDIGSGWGGLALDLAERAGAGSVKGITLSEEQLAASRRRATERGLDDRVRFELEDYRVTKGTFDRIVSVGMFEHVGVKDYETYFTACRRLLKDDGVVLLHTIGRTGRPAPTNAWITRYIFPGGHLPTLSEVAPAIERSGLVVTDIEVLRIHYAHTLRAWRERFMARREEAKALYDERFCRMWEAYLAMSESAFLFQDTVVFQIQLARRNDAVPITRNYIARRESAYADGRSTAQAEAAIR